MRRPIHRLVGILPYISMVRFMGFLMVKRSLMIFDRQTNLKYPYGSRIFFGEGGDYADTVGRNKTVPAEYIRNHEKDNVSD